MKMVLNIKDKRSLHPIKNDVIIFDGKDWYLTTKEDILSESLELLRKCREENERLAQENSEFKTQVASQLLKMSEIIKNMYSEE